MKFYNEALVTKALFSSLVLLQGALVADGHYGFPTVVVNGIESEWWEYVRDVGYGPYTGQFFPIYDWHEEGQVCGYNGTKTGHGTKTLKVEAGTNIKFVAYSSTYQSGDIAPHPYYNDSDGINHNGPGQAYMSLAPGALEDYDGSGDWFKIGSYGSTDGQYWDTDHDRSGMNFTIPKTTPPGKYLLRVEHFNISPYLNGTQQFINCAHVEVGGPGGGTPGPTTKFPGAYDIRDSAIWLPTAMWAPYKPTPLLKAYKGPGPEVWKG
ncbi:glycosyl hydrolase family 61-domain-containing protein [Lophiotrema nucula]|uniref:lytic cellulose monooxygenase (C4-dehydrogenating) n=1 Tax=Lophiotrema nucula TaxID=690887 RepID=A0A6A5ZFD2_9PLEO|nr:glycosyl hydrolase family 61-domain-containing protein [Lophiotrema nucula]